MANNLLINIPKAKKKIEDFWNNTIVNEDTMQTQPTSQTNLLQDYVSKNQGLPYGYYPYNDPSLLPDNQYINKEAIWNAPLVDKYQKQQLKNITIPEPENLKTQNIDYIEKKPLEGQDNNTIKPKTKSIDIDALYGKKGTYKRLLNELWGGSIDKYGNRGFGFSDALPAVKSVWDIYSGYKQGKLAEDMWNTQSKYLAQNYTNQAKDYNRRLRDQEIVRAQMAGSSYEDAVKKVNSEEWKKKNQIKERI